MNNNLPKISVIIPVYNSEKYLFESLESIRTQSFTDFECIVINDGSSDNSLNIINEFINKDERFQLIDSINEGTGSALNKGVLRAKSDLIARMDADDISHPDRLKIQYREFINSKKVDILGTNAIKVNKDGLKIGKIREFKTNSLCHFKVLLCKVPFIHPTTMIRKEVLLGAGLYPNLSRAQDYYLWNKLYRKATFKNINKNLLKYRNHELQTTYLSENNSNFFRSLHKLHIELLGNYDIHLDYNNFVFLFDWKSANISSLRNFNIVKFLISLYNAFISDFKLNFLEKINVFIFMFKIVIKQQILLKFNSKHSLFFGTLNLFTTIFSIKKST